MNLEQLVLTPISIAELKGIIQESVKEALSKLNEPKENELMTRKEVAKRMGVSLVTIHHWVKDGRIPCYKINTRVRFRKEDIDKFIYEIQKNSVHE